MFGMDATDTVSWWPPVISQAYRRKLSLAAVEQSRSGSDLCNSTECKFRSLIEKSIKRRQRVAQRLMSGPLRAAAQRDLLDVHGRWRQYSDCHPNETHRVMQPMSWSAALVNQKKKDEFLSKIGSEIGSFRDRLNEDC